METLPAKSRMMAPASLNELGIGYVVGRKPWAQLLHVGNRASECLGGKQDPGEDRPRRPGISRNLEAMSEFHRVWLDCIEEDS